MLDKEQVLVYSKKDCPWCTKAKELLDANGIEYQELIFGQDYTKEELQNLTGIKNRLTVPQIFIGGEHLGNYEQLKAWFMMNDAMKGK